jgi:hypothetical protein
MSGRARILYPTSQTQSGCSAVVLTKHPLRVLPAGTSVVQPDPYGKRATQLSAVQTLVIARRAQRDAEGRVSSEPEGDRGRHLQSALRDTAGRAA